MNIAEERMTLMDKRREKRQHIQAGLSGPKLGRIIRPLAKFSQILPKQVKNVDRLGESLKYTTRPRKDQREQLDSKKKAI
jgi:hypothetical protein